MKNKIRALFLVFALLFGLGAMAACKDAQVVNNNLDNDADNFKINRKVVFYNAIRDKVILEVEGFCSVDPGDGRRMSVTCKTSSGYKRNALGTSDNVLWWYEQLDSAGVSPDHYKFTVKPSVLIPDVEVR